MKVPLFLWPDGKIAYGHKSTLNMQKHAWTNVHSHRGDKFVEGVAFLTGTHLQAPQSCQGPAAAH